MLQRLMRRVKELESDANRADGAHKSSFDPYPPPESKARMDRTATELTNHSNNNNNSGQQKNSIFSDELKDSLKPKFSGYLPCHYFDYIGGTSTGG
jgi:hypothetical protein